MTSRQRRESLLRQVMHCRRRLRWLLLARYASVTVPTSMGVGAAIVFALRADGGHAAAWLIAALILAIAAAAGAAAWFAPSPRLAASALDKELKLQDRVVAALQFLSDDDPVAGLIVGDAADRISGVVPARVFPLDLRISRRAAMFPAAAAALAVAMAVVPEPARNAIVARFGGDALAAGPGRTVNEEHSAERREEAAQASPAAVSDAANAAKSMAASREGAESTRPVAADAENASMTRPSTELPAGDIAGAMAKGPAPAGAASEAQQSPGAGDAAAIDARGVAHADPEASRRGGAGSSGTAAAMDLREQRGGGVRSGAGERDFAPAPRIPNLEQRPNPARYQGAWARAQASLARNQVPATFRIYLRDYFVAIRPTGRE